MGAIGRPLLVYLLISRHGGRQWVLSKGIEVEVIFCAIVRELCKERNMRTFEGVGVGSSVDVMVERIGFWWLHGLLLLNFKPFHCLYSYELARGGHILFGPYSK